MAKGFASAKPLIVHPVLNRSTYQNQTSHFNQLLSPGLSWVTLPSPGSGTSRILSSAGASELGPGLRVVGPDR